MFSKLFPSTLHPRIFEIDNCSLTWLGGIVGIVVAIRDSLDDDDFTRMVSLFSCLATSKGVANKHASPVHIFCSKCLVIYPSGYFSLRSLLEYLGYKLFCWSFEVTQTNLTVQITWNFLLQCSSLPLFFVLRYGSGVSQISMTTMTATCFSVMATVVILGHPA